MKNKIHLEIEKPQEFNKMLLYANARFCVCGRSNVCGDNIQFTNDLNAVTCLLCVQSLFEDGKIKLVWCDK